MKRIKAFQCHQLVAHVASLFEISVEDLFASRDVRARKARRGAVYLMRRMTNAPLTMISEVLGYDSPQEVLYAIRIQEVRMKQDPAVRQQMESACKTIADSNWNSNSCLLDLVNGTSDRVLNKTSSWIDEDLLDC